MTLGETKSAASLNQDLGHILKVWRAEADLTQADVARAINISPQQFQKYETGASRMELSRLFEICAVFGKSPSAMLHALDLPDGVEPPEITIVPKSGFDLEELITRPELVDQADLSFLISELVSAFMAISDTKERETALYLVRSLAQRNRIAAE